MLGGCQEAAVDGQGGDSGGRCPGWKSGPCGLLGGASPEGSGHAARGTAGPWWVPPRTATCWCLVAAGDGVAGGSLTLPSLQGHTAPYKTVSARAAAPSTVLRLPAVAFQGVFEKYPETLARVVQVGHVCRSPLWPRARDRRSPQAAASVLSVAHPGRPVWRGCRKD